MKLVSCICFSTLYTVMNVQSLLLNVSPSVILKDVTDRFIVNCSYDTGSNPGLSSLTSLTVSRSSNISSLQYQVLSSLDSFSGVTTSDSIENLTTTGSIDNTGQSYLTLTWENPLTVVPGVYKCDATGMSSDGQPLTLSAITNVTSMSSSENVWLQEILKLRNYIEQLHKDTSAFMDTWTGRINLIQKTLFQSSKVFKGSQYLLYNYQPTNVPGIPQATCELFGGYLAEIQDSDEHDFIVSFIQTFSWLKSLLVGGSQAGEVGNWVYPSNNQSLEYYRWAYPYPFDAIDYDCLVLWSIYDFNLTNQQCTASQPSGSLYYLCEISQKN